MTKHFAVMWFCVSVYSCSTSLSFEWLVSSLLESELLPSSSELNPSSDRSPLTEHLSYNRKHMHSVQSTRNQTCFSLMGGNWLGCWLCAKIIIKIMQTYVKYIKIIQHFKLYPIYLFSFIVWKRAA